MLKSNLWCLLTERLTQINDNTIKCVFESRELSLLFLEFYRHIAKTSGIKLRDKLDSQQGSLFNDLVILEFPSVELLMRSTETNPGLYYCISYKPEESVSKSLFFIDNQILSRLISRYYSIHDYFPITKNNIPSNFRQFIIDNAIYIKNNQNINENSPHAISIISGETYTPAGNMKNKMLSLIVLEILAKSGSAESVQDLLFLLKRNGYLYDKIANFSQFIW